MFSKILGAAIIMCSSAVLAQGLQIGEPKYGGTGCPQGSASVSLSPGGDAVSLIFDQYVAEAGRTNGRRIDRKSCNISIPVAVPSGYSVAVFQIDYRGFNAIPAGGMSRLDAEYFWAGSRGPRVSRVFTGPTDDNYTVTDQLIASTIVWTPCGQQNVVLRANTSMMAQANSRMDQTMATVDSADVSSGLIYHMQFRRCY